MSDPYSVDSFLLLVLTVILWVGMIALGIYGICKLFQFGLTLL